MGKVIQLYPEKPKKYSKEAVRLAFALTVVKVGIGLIRVLSGK